MRGFNLMLNRYSRITAVLALVQTCAFAGEVVNDKSVTNTAPPAAPTSFCDSTALSQYFLGSDNVWDSTYDAIEKWKTDNHIPITIGANHWWHVDANQHIYGNGYGVPTEQGTYYYYVDVDPKVTLDPGGFISEIGIHSETRFRDGDKLRSYYRNVIWPYEDYLYFKTSVGTFKFGEIVQDFGIAWDNSWWEGISYFDGYKFNPSWGASWANTWKASDAFSVDTDLQYFIVGSRAGGAEPGADPNSSPPLEARSTGILRVVPTWKLNADTSLAWGGSFLVRAIGNNEQVGASDKQVAWNTDLTLTYKNFSAWAEYIGSDGVISPENYVSGGPSDRNDIFSTGINYKCGPVSAHVNYSAGWLQNPGGHQYEFNPGITFQLTKNVTLYTEYVKWDVTNSKGVTSPYDNGFELILVWKL
jgi:hypothetical protein